MSSSNGDVSAQNYPLTLVVEEQVNNLQLAAQANPALIEVNQSNPLTLTVQEQNHTVQLQIQSQPTVVEVGISGPAGPAGQDADRSLHPVTIRRNNLRWERVNDPSVGLTATDVANLRINSGPIMWIAPTGTPPAAADGLAAGDIIATY